MTQSQLDIQLIGAVTAAACAIPGVFLILRRMAMLTDAIGHAILFGIVVAFFAIGDLNSPLLIIGAALAGLLTVSLVEMLERTGRVRADAATGIVFPLLFGIGVILVSKYADNVHLDIDSVLLGEIAFAPFNRIEVGGVDLGPRGALGHAGDPDAERHLRNPLLQGAEAGHVRLCPGLDARLRARRSSTTC